MSKKIGLVSVILASAVFSTMANAGSFSLQGKVERTLISPLYAGCLIAMDKNIGHGCRSKWVSLDCKGLFFDKDSKTGEKKYASALVAAHTQRDILLVIDNTQKANGYCVASRLDVLFK